jgi:hypothetical protein
MLDVNKGQRFVLITTGTVLAIYLVSYTPWRTYGRFPVKSQGTSSQYEWIHVATPRLGLCYNHSDLLELWAFRDREVTQRLELATAQAVLESGGILVIGAIFLLGFARRRPAEVCKSGPPA